MGAYVKTDYYLGEYTRVIFHSPEKLNKHFLDNTRRNWETTKLSHAEGGTSGMGTPRGKERNAKENSVGRKGGGLASPSSDLLPRFTVVHVYTSFKLFAVPQPD